jgi:glutamine---fructose-6-phosphate transaminase (isomerizing)
MGVGSDFICCSSDLTSILEITDQIIQINDGEFVIFDDMNYQFYDIYTGSEIEKHPKKSDISIETANLEGYPHFMLKEIYEQPLKTKELIELLDNNTDKIEELSKILNNSANIYLVGSGTSYHACLIGTYYLNNLSNLSVTPVIAGAFNEYYLNTIKENDVIICVSQSGETKDLVNVINALKKLNKGKIIGIVNIVGSSISIKSNLTFNIAAGLEVSVPATKTFMNQILLLLYISLYLGSQKNNDEAKKIFEKINKIPDLLKETLDFVYSKCKDLVDEIKGSFEDSYCLGYGINYGTALEGALKIKEVYYKHCEGMYSSEFKHGPLSIVEKNYPIFFVACKEDSLMVISHINEITCRGGNVITISPYLEEYERYSTRLITLPDTNRYFTPFINTIATQLIAYFSSIKDGINPDFPRNISKTLTVD